MKSLRVVCLALTLIPLSTHGADQLTNVKDMYPSLPPDGSTMVLQSNRSGANEIWRMKADGSEPRRLTTTAVPGGAETPVWSPDGQTIVYARYVEENNNEVFLMDPEGGNQLRLTDSPGYDGHPHWSADGSRIVFNSDRDSPDPSAPWGERWHEIYSMTKDGSAVRKHTDCRGVCTYGSMSPDGQRIVFRKTFDTPGLNWRLEAIEKNSEVVVANLDGSGEINLSDSPAFDGWPIWSADGEWIAFASNRGGPALNGQIWLVRPNGKDARVVTEGPLSHVQPSWSANGDELLVYRLYEGPTTEFGGIARIQLP
jgi:TolB protein